MSLLFRKLPLYNTKNVFIRNADAQVIVISCRKLSLVPTIYDGDQDPAPKFFSPNVQSLLKRLTRPDFTKVFRKRTNSGLPVLKTPKYKFLTNKELEEEIANTKRKADRLLQMPPVVKVQQPINEVLSKDPALIGYDTATYLFTDISFGVLNEHRFIVQRDPDGTLRSCDHDIRKRLNQVYFPMNGRKIREPVMFTDDEKFHSLLDREQYEFVLDRACIQYDPDEPSYQRITSITYQHVDATKKYDLLRSTRHFGPLVFYLTWHQNIDTLMLELIQNAAIREAVVLMSLRQAIHGDVAVASTAEALSEQILNTPIQLTKPERVTEEDIELDTKCVDSVAQYILGNSSMKSQQELALQGFREFYQQVIQLSRGLRKAHGNAKPRNFTPLSILAERKAVKNGVHHAIFTSRFDRYVGDWRRDLKEGKGFFLTIKGKLYEGDWYKGYRHGFGTLSYRRDNGTYTLIYRGDWVYGKPEGIGWWWYDNGDVFFGFWKRGRRHGFGKMWYADGTYYVGYWNKDLKGGLGMFVQKNGNRYEGHWEDNMKNGLGRFYHMHTGQLQEGAWVNDVCVKSKMSDIIIRQFCDLPTEYPIPPEKLTDSKAILEESEFWLNQKIGDIDKQLQFCIDQLY